MTQVARTKHSSSFVDSSGNSGRSGHGEQRQVELSPAGLRRLSHQPQHRLDLPGAEFGPRDSRPARPDGSRDRQRVTRGNRERLRADHRSG